MSDPADLDAVAARRLIGAKRLSPVELLEACLARIARDDGAVNALVARDVERARAAARTAEAAVTAGAPLGRLHGLPLAVKDLQATAGLRTTWGSLIFKDAVPSADDQAVANARAAGAIVLAKSNTPEFGAGANTVNQVYGATRNPFDATKSVAGSSGGAAAALACGMVPLATGSDLGGSLRTPASFCSVVGFRPTAGIVPNETAKLGFSPSSVEGPMARTVADAALLLAGMAGWDGRDPLARAIDASALDPLPPVDLARLRVAFADDLGGAVPLDPGERAAFRAKAEAIAPLFGRADWACPRFEAVDATFAALRAVHFHAGHAGWSAAQRTLLGPMVRQGMEVAARIGIAEIAAAEMERTRLIRRCDAFFDDWDLVICPAASLPPYPVDQLWPETVDGRAMATYIHWVAITYAWTLTTHPVACLPLGLGSTGLPFGVQIVGRRQRDVETLAAAEALEAALTGDATLGRRRPPPQA